MSTATDKSLWRLSISYFFNFAAIGGLSIFLPLHLKNHGLDAQAIGQLMAIFGLTKIGIPNLIGWLTDQKSNHQFVIRTFASLLVVAFAGFFLADDYSEFAIVILIYSTLWSCLLPQYETTTVRHLGDQLHRYSHVRIWGSIGYVLTSLALGEFVEQYGLEHFLTVTFVLTIGTAICSHLLPKTVHTALDVQIKISVWEILKKKEVMGFFFIIFLIFISFATYGTFFSIYLQESHYSHGTIGFLWGASVIAEMALFLIAPKWVKQWGVRVLLLLSLFLTGLRWLLIGYGIEQFYIVFIAQLFHAASYGLLHIAAIQLVAHYFKGNNLAQGQALLTCAGFGLGNTLGSIISGYSWQNWGAETTFVWSAAVAFFAFTIAWLLVDSKQSA